MQDGAGEVVARAIGIGDGGGDALGLVTGEVCGAGIDKGANGSMRREEFDVAKERQAGNARGPAKALEWRVEVNVDSLSGLGADIRDGDE